MVVDANNDYTVDLDETGAFCEADEDGKVTCAIPSCITSNGDASGCQDEDYLSGVTVRWSKPFWTNDDDDRWLKSTDAGEGIKIFSFANFYDNAERTGTPTYAKSNAGTSTWTPVAASLEADLVEYDEKDLTDEI